MNENNLRTRPLLKIALAFFSGLTLAHNFPHLFPLWFPPSIISILIIILISGFLKSRFLEILCIYLLLSLSGCFTGIVSQEKYDTHPLHQLSFQSPEILFNAKVIDQSLQGNEKSVKLVKLENYLLAGQFYNVPAKAWLRVQEPVQLSYGDELVGRGILNPILPPRNPGTLDFAQFSRRKNVSAFLNCQAKDLKVTGNSAYPVTKSIVLPLRSAICKTLDHHIGGSEANILKGFLLGLQSELDLEFKRDLRYSGLWHLIALSGMHLGMLSGILLFIFTLFRIRGNWKYAGILAGIIIFCLIAEARAPLIRAGVVITLFICGRFFNRYYDKWNLLALSALLIVIVRPQELFSPGFQLSFASVAFILAGVERGQFYLQSLFPKLWRIKVTRSLLQLLLASVVATMGTAPLLACHFGGIPFASIPASLPGIPLAGIMLLLSFIFLLIAPLHHLMAGIFANSLWLSAKLFRDLVKISALPALYFPTPDFTFYHLILLEIPLLLLISVRRPWLWTGLISANVFLYLHLLAPANCRITFLDVGQGSSAVIELPDKQCIIVDAGPKSPGIFDAGESVITPFLQFRGLKKIDYIILTHNDLDHTGGVESVLKNFPVKNLVSNSNAKQFKLGCRNEVIRGGEHIRVGDAMLLFFNPLKIAEDENENSLVFSIDFYGQKVLFNGDISAVTENDLLNFGDLLKSDILLVAHHGSKRSTSEPFLKAVSPEFAVISCGRNDPYGHPSPEILNRLVKQNITILRTDLDHAIEFEITPRRINPIRVSKWS